MALPDSEPMIAGKTESEILAMRNRWWWYKTLSLEEKEKAMKIVDIAGRVKMGAAKIGKNNPNFGGLSEEHKTKLSAAMTNRVFSEEHKAKISASMTGRILSEEHKANIRAGTIGKTRTEEARTNYRAAWTPERRAKMSAAMTNRVFSEEHKAKISASLMGKSQSEEHRAKNSAAKMGEKNYWYGKTRIFSKESRAKMSAARIGKYTGENHPNWQGGTSFLPYCLAFNDQLKESIRNRDNRTCALCGKGEIQNGRRLSVHHMDADKMQGCNGKSWYLCALCRSCNVKPDTVEKEFLIVTNQNRVGGRR